MIKRAYAIQWKPDATAATMREVIAVLEKAPEHIPGMLRSTVHPSLGPGGYDLVWETKFADDDLYAVYLSHPYHYNIIDDLLYRESPGVAIVDSIQIRWSEEPYQIAAAPAAVAPATTADAEPTAVDPGDGPLVIVETVRLHPGSTDAYLQALRDDYLPMVAGRGIEIGHCLRSPPGTGEEELVILWHFATIDAFVAYRRFFQYGNEPASSAWIARISALRIGGRRRLMLPAAL